MRSKFSAFLNGGVFLFSAAVCTVGASSDEKLGERVGVLDKCYSNLDAKVRTLERDVNKIETVERDVNGLREAVGKASKTLAELGELNSQLIYNFDRRLPTWLEYWKSLSMCVTSLAIIIGVAVGGVIGAGEAFRYFGS